MLECPTRKRVSYVFKEHKHMLHSSLINFFMWIPINYGVLNFFRVITG